jgi:hypothetical protein
LASVIVLAVLVFAAVTKTRARNGEFARSAEPYRALARDLPSVLPNVASNSRLVIYDGVYNGAVVVWQDGSSARSIETPR